MKIISRYNDYFDSALHIQNDKTPLWIRKIEVFVVNNQNRKNGDNLLIESEISKKINKLIKSIDFLKIDFKGSLSQNYLSKKSYISSYDVNFTINSGFISFVGKIYPFVKITKRHSNYERSLEYQYTLYDFKSFEEKFEKIDIVNKELLIDTIEKVRLFFKKISIKQTDDIHVFLDTPIFIYDFNLVNELRSELNEYISLRDDYYKNGFLVSDGGLKEYQFIKFFDPNTLIQEIEMYFGNTLIKKDEPKEFNDLIKIESHGFDKKVSFRKRKSE